MFNRSYTALAFVAFAVAACASETGDTELEKEAWVSAVLLEWGSCGKIAYVDGVPAGYMLFAPPAYDTYEGTLLYQPSAQPARNSPLQIIPRTIKVLRTHVASRQRKSSDRRAGRRGERTRPPSERSIPRPWPCHPRENGAHSPGKTAARVSRKYRK